MVNPKPTTLSPRRGEASELALVLTGFAALTVGLTYPLAFRLGTIAYGLNNGDMQFAIWNVAWVARTLVLDPLAVFHANIFYPHRFTLLFSEANLGSGVLAIPVYWATRNPYAAYNFVLLLSFVLSATGTYYLIRYLVHDRRAAVVGAISFAFCPFVFSHLPNIQLLMTAGIPFSMLAFHRLVDRPSPGHGAALGLVMAAQAYFCAYYAVFVMLLVGWAVVVLAAWRRTWTSRRFWTALGVAAAVAVALTLPLFLRYWTLQRETGFVRSLDDARMFSAHWRSYFASAAYAHSWMLKMIERWNDVLFPGFVPVLFGVAGTMAGWIGGGRFREIAVLYGSVAGLAFWESLGPDGGLYRLTYATVPAFTFLRAPSRFGLLVIFALSILAALAVQSLLARVSLAGLVSACLVAMAVLEHVVPLRLMPVPPPEPAYQILATQPYGAVLELPVFSPQFRFIRARYMLSSTTHWMPLVNAYSDHIPPESVAAEGVLGEFPSRQAFALVEKDKIRYAVFHLDLYGKHREALLLRLKEFASFLRLLYADERMLLYEIAAFPD